MNLHRIIATFATFASLTGAGNAAAADPVTQQQSWRQAYTVDTPAPRLRIDNIWGSVRVRSGGPGEIVIAVVELRSAPDQALFERSLEQLRLDVEADTGGVSIQVGDRHNRWRHEDECRGCRVDYQFDVLVPPGSIVDVATVMDGIVDVQDVDGTVSAGNVNGPVEIGGLRDCDSINSVNGKVRLGFSQVPTQDCSIETVNGDITIDVPAGSNLDLAVDLFNGDIRSELPVDTFAPPATVEHVVEDGRNRYRIQQLAGIRIGAGGPVYTVASMNGDVRIRKHQ